MSHTQTMPPKRIKFFVAVDGVVGTRWGSPATKNFG